MIKALTKCGDGRPMIILGLSARNLQLLREKKPILVDLAVLGIPASGVVLIIGGEDEQAILATMVEELGLELPKVETPS